MKPGIYPDVPEADYHADEALSQSGAKLLLDCPARYLADRRKQGADAVEDAIWSRSLKVGGMMFAAGAVLVAACGAGIMGYLILAKYILPHYGKVLTMFGSPSDLGTVVSILIVTIVVIIIKSLSGTGTPLHGGVPSGHAAVAFSIATAVSLNTADPLISLLCFAMAIMVSHSRLLMRIHSGKEVVIGSLVGAGITIIVLLTFRYLG